MKFCVLVWTKPSKKLSKAITLFICMILGTCSTSCRENTNIIYHSIGTETNSFHFLWTRSALHALGPRSNDTIIRRELHKTYELHVVCWLTLEVLLGSFPVARIRFEIHKPKLFASSLTVLSLNYPYFKDFLWWILAPERKCIRIAK